MIDYESNYEEYKMSLLKSWNFVDRFKKEYEKTLSSERNYIDQSGVLWKIGILCSVCGMCFAFLSGVDAQKTLLRVFLSIIGIVCFFLALYIGSKYKHECGKSTFFYLYYDKYIKDKVRKDKQKETEALLIDMLDCFKCLKLSVNVIKTGGENSDLLKENLLDYIDGMDDFHKRNTALSLYDRYESDITEDFTFRKSINEHLK